MPDAQTTNRMPIPILTYHQIAHAHPRGTPFRSLCVDPDDFRKQMGFLKLLGYSGLSMTALQPYLAGERTGKVFGITFDDGYLNNLENALPVLNHFGFSSTCYVVSQLVGKSNEWDREVGIPQSALMASAELKMWMSAGQEVGAHTRHHVKLLQLDDASCRTEIALCKQELEELTGTAVAHFCYPYGGFKAKHVELVQEAGYVTATTTQRSRCLMGEDLLQLPRVPVARTTTRPALWLKVATGYEDRRREK
jgi:peptidoglycan/xylan/chitin deacetylase (PgdA/CDA1 family)